jgi:hypothetical protein
VARPSGTVSHDITSKTESLLVSGVVLLVCSEINMCNTQFMTYTCMSSEAGNGRWN